MAVSSLFYSFTKYFTHCSYRINQHFTQFLISDEIRLAGNRVGKYSCFFTELIKIYYNELRHIARFIE